MTQIIQGTVKIRLQVKSGPGSSYGSAGELSPGDRIEADRNQAQWLHLTKINGAAVTGEKWASDGGQAYISWSWRTVTDPGVTTPPPDGKPLFIVGVFPDGSVCKYVLTP